MTPEDVVARVFDVPREEVTDASSSASTPAWDSMGHINLIMEIDSTFGISLSPDDAFRIKDVASLKEVLADHGIR